MQQEPYSFEQIIKALRRDADAASGYIGYIMAVVDEEVVGRKLGGSVSGKALAIATSAVKQALVLYCARSWEKAGRGAKAKPVISIPAAIEHLRDPAGILPDWESRNLGEPLGNFQESIDRRHPELLAEYDRLAADTTHGPFRILRTENYAHLALESSDRKRLEANGPLPGATWNDLLRLSEETVRLVGQIGYFWDRSNNPYPDRIQDATRHCREFWRVLPVLEVAEDRSID